MMHLYKIVDIDTGGRDYVILSHDEELSLDDLYTDWPRTGVSFTTWLKTECGFKTVEIQSFHCHW
jgi:hypothetical protein